MNPMLIYGQYVAFWKCAWDHDERENSGEMYDQLIAEDRGWA